MGRRGRTGQVLREFGVVLVGVFCALAAESWWSEREDRRFERELRDDILVEFQANLRILESDLATNDTSRAQVAELTILTEPELVSQTSSAMTDKFGDYPDWAGFDPEMGIVQALVESGNVSQVSDRTLRLLLSQWAGLLEEKRRFNLQTVEFQNHQVVPVVARVTADLVWTEAERREVQSLYRAFALLQAGVIANQQRLRTTALAIREHLIR